MRDVTLVILNSLRIKCHIRRPLKKISTKAQSKYICIAPKLVRTSKTINCFTKDRIATQRCLTRTFSRDTQYHERP